MIDKRPQLGGNSPIANYTGKLYNLPFNMNTFYQMQGVTRTAEAEAKLEEQRTEAMAKMKAEGVISMTVTKEYLKEDTICLSMHC